MPSMTIDAHGNIHEGDGRFGGHIRTEPSDGTVAEPANPILSEFRFEYGLASSPGARLAIIDQWLEWTYNADEGAPWVVQERGLPMRDKTHRILTLLRAQHADEEIGDFIATGGAIDIGCDDVVILQHAEGDFDAETVGFESIELYRDDETDNIVATAITDLDLHWLSQDETWLDHHRQRIEQAFTDLYPDGRLSVPDLYDNAEFRFDVSREGAEELSADDAVRLVQRNASAQQFIADTDSDALWTKLSKRIEELTAPVNFDVNLPTSQPDVDDDPDADDPDLSW